MIRLKGIIRLFYKIKKHCRFCAMDHETERIGTGMGAVSSNTTGKRKLFLINGRQQHTLFARQTELCHLLGKRTFTTPLALPTLAALTPDHYDITIIDEDICSVPEDVLPDLVGITTKNHTVHRAYELADWYRSKGVPVILGGAYSSYMIEEGLQHADCVAVGEMEDIWQDILADFERGELKSSYQAEAVCEFRSSPRPRWDLIDTDKILALGVQISRGCPFRCEFCLVTKMQGNRMRYREIDDVIAEIESLPSKILFFVDDNLTMNKKYAMELMDRLEPLNLSWTCQASIDVSKDPVLLDKMAKAGCQYILVGFESVNPDCLVETRKLHNKADDYKQAIDRIHAAGIQIIGAFIIGFDHDTLDEFDHIEAFSREVNLPLVMINVLGIAPGTDIYERMEKEGRLYGTPTVMAAGMFPPFRYMNMSHVDIFDRYVETLERMYSFEQIGEKALNLFSNGAFQYTFDDPNAGVAFKAKATAMLIRSYLLTGDKHKRKLFLELMKLVRQKKISPNIAIIFLVSMEGFHRHVKQLRADWATLREEIVQNDRGAWDTSSVQAVS